MICNGGEKSPPFLFGPLAQLVRALPCHGRGRRFKSDMDRNKYLFMIMYKYSPAVLRELKLCYDSHKKSPENYCKCQWGPL
jgi:hypothetical protein